jgi:FkbM family methyltransferase
MYMACDDNCTKIYPSDNITNNCWHRLLDMQFKNLTSQYSDLKVLDIGANIGEFVFSTGDCENVSEIYAVEPFITSFQNLKRNVGYASCINKIKLLECAISNRNGKSNIYSGNGTCETFNILGDRFNNEQPVQEVNTITIDCLSEKLNTNFDIIKIDVEGAECLVLEGGIKTIKNCKYVFVEVHGEETTNFKDVLQICKDNNWRVFCLKHLHEIDLDAPTIKYCYQLVIKP